MELTPGPSAVESLIIQPARDPMAAPAFIPTSEADAGNAGIGIAKGTRRPFLMTQAVELDAILSGRTIITKADNETTDE